VDLTKQTTLRAGDSFKIEIQGTGARTATITIEPGRDVRFPWCTRSTPSSAASARPVSITPAAARNLKIQVNAGRTINLIAGPDDFDALARLGSIPAC
jgi:hypothetical protein